MRGIDFSIFGTLSPNVGFGKALQMTSNVLRSFGQTELYDIWKPDGNPKFENILVQGLANQTQWIIDKNPRLLLPGRRRIAFWMCESTGIHGGHVKYSKFFDEIWTASNFCKLVFEQLNIPVKVIPHIVTKYSMVESVEKKFRFVNYFDGGSRILRKNPFDLVDAFVKAFGSRDDVELVIKTKQVGASILDYLRLAARGSNVRIINEDWTGKQMEDLLQSAHCFISLHKGEGFGLGLLEAMAFGKPVIATEFSGNTDFMNQTNSLGVTFELKEVDDMLFTGCWAYPNIDDAVDKMRFIVDKPAVHQALSKGAYQTAMEWNVTKMITAVEAALS